MPRWNLGWILGISAVILLGYTVSHSAPPREHDQDYELVRLVVDVLEEVEHKYVRPLDAETKRKLVEDMVNGGLERLDPHSVYINSHEYKRFLLNNRGKFGGVGIQISTERKDGRYLKIMSPMIDTPAYEAGVLPNDLITKIDGKSTENMRVSEAIDMIQGEPGSKIVLTVLHEGEKTPVDLEMNRAEIHVQSVLGDQRKAREPSEWEYLIDKHDKIAYVRLIAFNETTASDFHKVLETAQEGRPSRPGSGSAHQSGRAVTFRGRGQRHVPQGRAGSSAPKAAIMRRRPTTPGPMPCCCRPKNVRSPSWSTT